MRLVIGAQVTVGENPAVTCTPILYVQNKNGRTLGRRTAIKTNIQGQNTTPNDASKSKSLFGETGSSRDRVPSARKQRLAFDSSSRPNHVPPIGGFPGSGEVVDPPSQSRLAVRPGPITADQKTWVLRLFVS
jgi:hypothetical protein